MNAEKQVLLDALRKHHSDAMTKAHSGRIVFSHEQPVLLYGLRITRVEKMFCGSREPAKCVAGVLVVNSKLLIEGNTDVGNLGLLLTYFRGEDLFEFDLEFHTWSPKTAHGPRV